MKPVGRAKLLEPCAFLLSKLDNNAGLIEKLMLPGCCTLPTAVPGVALGEKAGFAVGRLGACMPCVIICANAASC